MAKQQSGTDGTDERSVADDKRDRPGFDDDEPVPRIPRSAGFKLSMPALIRILLTAAMLTMIIVAQRPCADAVSGFVTSFDNDPNKVGSGSATPQTQMPKPGTVDMPSATQGSAGDYEPLRPDMTEAEIKAAIERAKARAKEAENPSSTGSAAGTAGSGSAGTTP